MGWLASIAQLLGFALGALGLFVAIPTSFYVVVVMLGADGGIGLRSGLWAVLGGWAAFFVGKWLAGRAERG